MQQMMRQAQQMQEKLQQEIALLRVEATAGGGIITVKMDGQKNLISVKIDPEAAGDVEMLQDLMVAACNEAVKMVDAQIQQKSIDRKPSLIHLANSNHPANKVQAQATPKP